MTSCGGTCQALPGGAIVIRLSAPLLSLRPFKETQDVLLHEMIHAEHFVKGIRDDDVSGHGTLFKAKMRAINGWSGDDIMRPLGGYNITVTHSMIDEVRYFQKHHWVCTRCGDFVQRSMNRVPQKADCRAYRKGGEDVDCGDVRCMWHTHKRFCGGVYVKIAGDDGKDRKKKRKDGAVSASGKAKGRIHSPNIERWLSGCPSSFPKKEEKRILGTGDNECSENKDGNMPVIIDLTSCEVVDLT